MCSRNCSSPCTENATLHIELDKAKGILVQLESKMMAGMNEDCNTIAKLEKKHAGALETHSEELNAYREAVEVLKKNLQEKDADKTRLTSEVERLKADFSEVIAQFEEELTLSSMASDAALQEKTEECETAKTALRAKQEELAMLESRLEEFTSEMDSPIAQQQEEMISSLRSKLSEKEAEKKAMEMTSEEIHQSLQKMLKEKESEREELQEIVEELKADNMGETAKLQNENEQLKSKLKGALFSIEENMRLSNGLREEKGAALQELVQATEKLDETVAWNKNFEVELASLREQVITADQERHKATKAADEAQEERQKATTRIDEMISYTEKLKIRHDEATAALQKELDDVKKEREETMSSLKNQIDGQMSSMKEVIQSLQGQLQLLEAEKEDNKRMHEKDISLQQSVSLCTYTDMPNTRHIYLTELSLHMIS